MTKVNSMIAGNVEVNECGEEGANVVVLRGGDDHVELWVQGNQDSVLDGGIVVRIPRDALDIALAILDLPANQ